MAARDNEILTVRSTALPAHTRVAAITGVEGMSRLYYFDIALDLVQEAFDVEMALRAPASLTIRGAHVYQGIIVAMELVHCWGERSLYRATLVPRLWELTQSIHSRIYTDNTIIEIIGAVLDRGGLASRYRFDLVRSYPTLEHVCQYKESDFRFVSRWLEKEGLYYYFEHDGDAETLVISDSQTFQQNLGDRVVRYEPLAHGDAMIREAFEDFTARHAALPARVRMKDYDYTHPAVELEGRHTVAEAGRGEISIFGEGLLTPSECRRYAEVRAQEYQTRQRVFRGRGRVFGLRPAHRFTLDDHPATSYNAKPYTVTEVHHVCNQAIADARLRRSFGLEEVGEREYLAGIEAIPATVQYRSERIHGWPRIQGYELAVIDGPAPSDYAQIDDAGRYKCRIMFDESDLVDGNASSWVRMMQPHGGGLAGFHFPLRKGTEVLVWFLGGDPDRPVIAGVSPNPLKPSPVTGANHTKNVIRTGSNNFIELEDKLGSERITLSSPHADSVLKLGSPNHGHSAILKTKKNALLSARGSYDVRVGTNHHIRVTGAQTAMIARDVSVFTGGNQHEHASGARGIHASNIEIATGSPQGSLGDALLDDLGQGIGMSSLGQVGEIKNMSETAKHIHTKGFEIRVGAASVIVATGYIRIDNGAGAWISLLGGMVFTNAADATRFESKNNLILKSDRIQLNR